MPEEVKFNEEEMKKINDLQQTYADIQRNLGQTAVTRLRLERQIEELDTNEEDSRQKFTEAQETEKNILGEINKKYGEGVLNPETGIFTPSPKK